MAGSYQTGSAEMLAAVNSMEQANNALQANLRNLQSEVDAVRTAWVGTAATAFNNLMLRFNEDATSLNQDLHQISEAVRGNNAAYQQSEDQQHSSMTQILGGL